MINNNVKRDKFHRVAESRTNKIVSMIRLLGNCSNKSNYSYTEEEVRKIFAFIDKELKVARSKFSESGSDTEDKFHF